MSRAMSLGPSVQERRMDLEGPEQSPTRGGEKSQ